VLGGVQGQLPQPCPRRTLQGQGRVVKSGKTISVCDGKLFAFQNGQGSLVAMMQATMICIRKD
jgi:acyl-coenzyme A thioesterase PaaI-like protein